MPLSVSLFVTYQAAVPCRGFRAPYTLLLGSDISLTFTVGAVMPLDLSILNYRASLTFPFGTVAPLLIFAVGAVVPPWHSHLGPSSPLHLCFWGLPCLLDIRTWGCRALLTFTFGAFVLFHLCSRGDRASLTFAIGADVPPYAFTVGAVRSP